MTHGCIRATAAPARAIFSPAALNGDGFSTPTNTKFNRS